MSYAAYRPENALRRARDFEAAGDKDKAMEHLFEVLTARKMGRTWQPAHEAMMLKFVELCVEYREARKCKEGLHCYRYLQAGAGAPHPLEKIIVFLIDVSLKKAAEARARTESAAAVDAVEDLEEEQSPESLLMGGVTSEGSRDRAERETLVPWLRHMLDTFRFVLETLRNMPALEHLYHHVAVRAMLFCRQYNRTGEFKKLIATLRAHLKTFLDNYNAQLEGTVRDERIKPITPESIERQLSTRFYALETCADMSLWSEGFRIIEDIHAVMDKTALQPKNHLMATYYEKLARIFWVSENFLFHAYAWWRFYTLSVAHNTKLTDEDKRVLASAVTLATIAIPTHTGSSTVNTALTSSASAAAAVDALLEGTTSTHEKEKREFLARLLKWTSSHAPSRDALLAELAAKGVFRIVRPEVAALVRVVETDFSPLALVARAQPLIDWVVAQTGPTLPAHVQVIGGSSARAHTMAQYAGNLERVVVLRLLEQLTAVYTTVKLSHFRALTVGLRMSPHDVEKLIVRSVRSRQLAVRIDHHSGIMRLGSEAVEAASLRRQLAELSARLQLLVDSVYPGTDFGSSVPAERREAVFAIARRTAEPTRRMLSARKEAIQKRKEDDARDEKTKQNMRKAREAEELKKKSQVMLEKATEEEERRKRAQAEAVTNKIKEDDIRRLAEQAGMDVSKMEAAALKHLDTEALRREVREKALKARDEELRRRTEQARRMDYLTRALREAERVKVEALLRTQLDETRAYVAAYNSALAAKDAKRAEDGVALQPRLPVIAPILEVFTEAVLAQRRSEYEVLKREQEKAAKFIFLRRKLQQAHARKAEDDARRLEMERRKREEELEERAKTEREKADGKARREFEERTAREMEREMEEGRGHNPAMDEPWRRSAPSAAPTSSFARGGGGGEGGGGGGGAEGDWSRLRGGGGGLGGGPAPQVVGAPPRSGGADFSQWRSQAAPAAPPNEGFYRPGFLAQGQQGGSPQQPQQPAQGGDAPPANRWGALRG